MRGGPSGLGRFETPGISWTNWAQLGLDDPSVSWKGVEGGPELRRGPAQHSQDQDWAQGGTNSPRGL